MTTCAICGDKAHAKNLCQKHYRRQLSLLRGKVVSSVQDLSLKEKIIKYSSPDPITGCWNWSRSTTTKGYGQITSTQTKTILAHRASYEAFIGEISEGLFACHKCDNPSCVNPEHLFLGTAKDNAEDRNLKQRQAKGSSFNRSSLTNDDILFIRLSAEKLKYLATKFNVSLTLISQIKRRKKWKHI